MRAGQWAMLLNGIIDGEYKLWPICKQLHKDSTPDIGDAAYEKGPRGGFGVIHTTIISKEF